MAGWHHQLIGCECEWTLGVGDGQEGLACCSPWGCKELDTATTEVNWYYTFSCVIKTKIRSKSLQTLSNASTPCTDPTLVTKFQLHWCSLSSLNVPYLYCLRAAALWLLSHYPFSSSLLLLSLVAVIRLIHLFIFFMLKYSLVSGVQQSLVIHKCTSFLHILSLTGYYRYGV